MGSGAFPRSVSGSVVRYSRAMDPTPSQTGGHGGGLGFRLFGLPVTVQPWFFLTAWIVGRQSIDVVAESVWIVIVFLGVLVHELGHAVAARRLGLEPRITLHGHVHESSAITGSWKDLIGETRLFSAAYQGEELSLVQFDALAPGQAVRRLL